MAYTRNPFHAKHEDREFVQYHNVRLEWRMNGQTRQQEDEQKSISYIACSRLLVITHQDQVVHHLPVPARPNKNCAQIGINPTHNWSAHHMDDKGKNVIGNLMFAVKIYLMKWDIVL